jgi:transposase InsO family protein
MDGSHPPFRNVRAACAKALTFTWISHFGVPETITYDRGPQFTSNLWFQLWEMFNISHKQPTAYHPELNGAMERLHRCLKDTLSVCVAAATWSEELPFVLLGLRAQPREDTGLSPAEAVFGALIVLPNEFLQNDELSVETIVKKISKTLHASAPSLPRHSSSTDLPSELPAELLSAPSSGSVGAAWFHPFSRSTTAPTRSCAAAPAPSPSESGRGTRWSPSAAFRLAQLGHHAWQPALPWQTAGLAPRRSCRNQVGLVFRPAGLFTFLFSNAATRRSWNRFPTRLRRFLHAQDRRRLHSLHRHGTRLVNRHRPRG